MTEFEMAYLLTDMQSAMANEFAILFSLLFGFLGASYVAAHRLSRMMLSVAIPSYTLLYFLVGGLLKALSVSFFGLISQMHAFSASGKGLLWHASATAAPAFWIPVVPYVVPTILLLTYVGSLVFFFQCRRVNRKTEMGAEAPKV